MANKYMHKDNHHPDDAAGMDRPAEVENQREEDRNNYFGKYLSGAGTAMNDASKSALTGRAMFQSGKYDRD